MDKNEDLIRFLESLVDYVNTNPAILNGKPYQSKDLYDPNTKLDRYGRSVATPTPYNMVAIDGLTNFFQSRRAMQLERPKTVFTFLEQLYDQYGITFPWVQSGGYMSEFEMQKAQITRGDGGIRYLENLYKSVVNSLTNVTLDPSAIVNIENGLTAAKNLETTLLSYMEFVYKVKENYDLLKYAPSKVQLNGDDVIKLQNSLNTEIAKYQKQENTIAELIESLARKEKNPNAIVSAFD